MKRITIMFKQRRLQALIALAAVPLAIAAFVGSGASFSADTVNAKNVYSAGKLETTNTPSGMSVTVSKMVPGDRHAGSVVIENTGSVQGEFYLEAVKITDDSMIDDGFAKELQLTINDDGKQLYTGSLSGLKQHDLGLWQSGDRHAYEITVSFPDDGPGAENAYMDATTSAAFTWTAVSVAKGDI
jgi:hypothetical protein